MTRITFSQINNMVQSNLARNFTRLNRLQEQLSSGKRIQRPSDAPGELTNDLQMRSQLRQTEQFKRNINDGRAYMAILESTLVGTNNLYQRTRELAIQGSNDTNTATERGYIMNEVRVLLDQMVSISNTSYRGNFIFSGTETKAQPFELRKGRDTIDDADNTILDNTDTFLSATNTLPKTIQVWDRSITDSKTASGNAQVRDIVPGTLSLAGLTEGVDYSVDYVKGTITFPNSPTINIPSVGNLTLAQIHSAMPANFPAWPPSGDPAWGGAVFQPQPGAGIQLDYEWIRRNEKDLDGAINREIAVGLVGQINTTASQAFGDPNEVTSWDAMIRMMEGLHENRSSTLLQSITELNGAFQRTVSAQAMAGARTNRFDTTDVRNEEQYIETTRLHSEIEDVDFAKVISDFVLQEAVYSASLQSASRVIQPSLGNFL